MTLIASFATMLLLNFLYAQLSLERESRWVFGERFKEIALPEARVLRAAFLGYDTFAADLAWISLNVNLGAARGGSWRLTRLRENAAIISEVDPRFYRLYQWFNAVWAFGNRPMKLSDVVVADELLSRGMEVFPDDPELPFSLAMTYVGVPDADDAARIRRYERIVELVKRSLAAKDPHPDNAWVLLHFQRRLQTMKRGETRSVEEHRDFLIRLYLRTAQPHIRHSIREVLRDLGGGGEAIETVIAADEELMNNRRLQLPYVSPELFTLVTQDV